MAIVARARTSYCRWMIDRRFPTALQIMQSLVLMERQDRPWVSSAEFATYFRVNPTLMRRLLTTLVQHGLLQSQMGRNGGVRLARKPEAITLRDIYYAAVADKKLWTPRTNIPRRCTVSRNFGTYFESLEEDADLALANLLASRTLAESYAELECLETANESSGRVRMHVSDLDGPRIALAST